MCLYVHMYIYICIYMGKKRYLQTQNFPKREVERRCAAMGPFKSSVFILALCLLEGALSNSLIQLNNNGYEGIVIAIDSNVPEDETLIQQIKDMVTQASPYMFEATEKRFYFKNVAILIPEKWKTKPEYVRPKLETYKNADVLVAVRDPPGNDGPYTEQIGKCGEMGEKIHLTPDFLAGKLLKLYGPQGRAFVHEWAHLRWGVFDEYNNDQKFYLSKGKNQPVRCSADITGKNEIYKCQGGSCITRRCRPIPATGEFEKECEFIPDEVQTEKASIMFSQKIQSVVAFCTEKNHNKEAPNLQNQKCNLQSTWTVISDSEDFKKTTPMTTQPPQPTFSLLQIGQRIVCLVLDKSGSMTTGDRLKRLNQAGKLFLLQIIEQGSWVGMVTFDSAAYVQSDLIQIQSATERDVLTKRLPTTASGGTSICSGLRSAFTVIRKKYPTDGSEIVLLTDGEDYAISTCFNEVKQSGAIIHTVALGPSAARELEELSKMTGGLQTFASDNVQNNGLIDAFGALSSGNGAVSQRSIQLESKGLTFQNSQWMNGTVMVDSTVGKDTLFLITWTAQSPEILLWDPSGNKQGGFIVDTLSKMTYLQIPGTAKVGVWKYSLRASSQTLTLTVTSRASSATLPPITVTPKMNKATGTFPNPMVVYANIRQGALPILRASVTALIESASGKTVSLELLDNGAGADAIKDDGVYSRYFTAYDTNGRYSLKVWALGGRNEARQGMIPQQNGAMRMAGWIENGEVKWNPRPRTEGLQKQVCFSRTSSGGSFVASNVPNAPIPDLFPPCQITDLKAKIQGGSLINLTWTAPGDDYDQGRAHKYIVRISTSILDLKDKFDDSLQVNTTELIPKEVNSKEVFVFKPENITFENGTDIFIAVKAVDEANLKSEISNIAQVSLFIPSQTPEIPCPDDSSIPCVDVSVNSTIPGIHILKIMWKWLGELQVPFTLS
ncbi:calcium-activated chloride channel regulator 1 [Dasypus novemcinctus]|uniref:calcium-activated chloride channel regulator 1 n=1 Tax=Dasypus novemcinctus TaxID=9361 RepID=UPI002660322E|nr:calcium-activated chloride channel regulator 1 [Dasypus novemcinctus]